MARVLVTGGAGFIGSHLCDRLVDQGHEVVVLDNVSSGSWSNLAHLAGQITRIEDDVAHVLDHREALKGVSRIYHLAALISGHDSLKEPDAYIQTNVSGLLRVVDLCRHLERPRIVFASTSGIYAHSAATVRSESTPPGPLTPYALSKLMGEHILKMYASLAGFEHVSLRLFNVYGPRQSPDHPYANVTCKFARAAAFGTGVSLYGDGHQTRDFVYVEDVVDAFMLVSQATEQPLYNVGTGRDASISELLELVQELGGQRLHIERLPPWPNDITAIRADIERISRELGFGARVDLREGLRRTIAWFREASTS